MRYQMRRLPSHMLSEGVEFGIFDHLEARWVRGFTTTDRNHADYMARAMNAGS